MVVFKVKRGQQITMSYSYPTLLLTDVATAEAVSSGAYPLMISDLFPSAILLDSALPSSSRVEDKKATSGSCVEKETKQKCAPDRGFFQRFMLWWKGKDDGDGDNRGNSVMHTFLDGTIASPSALFLASTRSLDAYEWALDVSGRRGSFQLYLST